MLVGPLTFTPGDALNGPRGRYVVEAAHASGGTAVGLRGRREADGLPVFIKLLRAEHLTSWKARDAFAREAALLRALHLPGVPAFVDDFAVERPGGGAPLAFALVTEFVPGETLRATARGSGLSRTESLRWLDEVLAILEALHARVPPIVHRDLAPKNIILRPDGHAALVDFGSVAHALGAADEHQPTSTGTFGYAPPEQFLGRATPASDLYALGMTYLAAASGREPEQMPLAGHRVVVAEVLHGDPQLVRLIEAMTEPDPRRRLGDAACARARLAPIRAGVALQIAGSPAIESAAPSFDILDIAPAFKPPPVVARALDLDRYATRLAARLESEGFAVEEGGELLHSPLLFVAERRAIFERDVRVVVARGETLEGNRQGRALDVTPVALLARAAGDGVGGADRMAQLLAQPPVVLLVLLAEGGVGAHTAARLPATLRRFDEATVVVALVDGRSGVVELAAPPGPLDAARRRLIAWIRALTAPAGR